MAAGATALPLELSQKYKNLPKDSSLHDQIIKDGAPSSWINALQAQKDIPWNEKGWQCEFEWKESGIPEAGIGAFSKELIKAGSLMRIGVVGFNLFKFDSPKDLPPMETTQTKDWVRHYSVCVPNIDEKFGDSLFILGPGCGINHTEKNENTSYCYDTNLNALLVHAIRDIPAGEELVMDYKKCINPCGWLMEYYKTSLQNEAPLFVHEMADKAIVPTSGS